MRRLSSLSLFLCLGLVAPASPEIRVLRQGREGYVGVRDTFVSTGTWEDPPQVTVNYGRNPVLNVVRDQRDSVLIRFDLGTIPPNAVVARATLSLYNTSEIPNIPARRVSGFRLLRDWDEGNQVASALDAPGKRGATGVFAFAYFPGEGANVAWGEAGLQMGTDFSGTPLGTVGVRGIGWNDWDLTATVREWVRHPETNHGLVLRDASGWSPLDLDERAFASSDAADEALRPRLTLDVDVDTPYADAGPDVRDLGWSGGPVVLDGSASRDRPGGDDDALRFEWRVTKAAFGSSLGGVILSTEKVAPVALDRPGEWEIELAVTNNVGRTATDRVRLQLVELTTRAHPRIFLSPARREALRARAQASNPRWVQLRAAADPEGANMIAQALVYQMTGETDYCDHAIATALGHAEAPSGSTIAGDLAIVYDWCHERLGEHQRVRLRDSFAAWADGHAANPGSDQPGWGNFWPNYSYSYALIGAAAAGEDARALEWLEQYRYRRYQDYEQPALDRIAAGGAWPEGTVYDPIANLSRIEAVEAWRTATGEDLFESTSWYRERLGYFLLNNQPGLLVDPFGYPFHPYSSTGDSERNRGAITGYTRIMGLMLIRRYPEEPLARQLRAYLAASPGDEENSHFPHREFLWFDPDGKADPPSRLTHYAAGTGTVLARSGWPRGAADDDPRATFLSFQCGDHFSYHQHYDQNAFTLFRGGDLVVDSGTYSGEGLSQHDVNYYIRTVAHNTLVVYNPDEDLSGAGTDSTSNDGGQRTFYPASRAPVSVEAWDASAAHYDTCDMLRFEDGPRYTYALGDATKAYNSPLYSQAQDTQLSGNEAKVSRFQREVVYLRPQAATAGEYVVLFDRVGVTREAFSGANTKLLFHFLQEPEVGGAGTPVSPGEVLYSRPSQAVATSGEGKVFLQFLAPLARNVRKVGGRGEKAFWVFGQSYDWHWSPNEPQPRPTTDFDPEPYGEWRLELEPVDTRLAHGFLTVLHPADREKRQVPPSHLVQGDHLTGAHIADPALNHVVLFASSLEGTAPEGLLEYAFRPTARSHHLVADLTTGARYRRTVETVGDGLVVRLVPDPEGTELVGLQGVLSFDVAFEAANRAEPGAKARSSVP